MYLLDGDPKRGFLDWLVNFSIEQFVYLLTRAMSFFEEGRKTGMNSTQLLGRELEVVDDAAFERSTHWWSVFYKTSLHLPPFLWILEMTAKTIIFTSIAGVSGNPSHFRTLGR